MVHFSVESDTILYVTVDPSTTLEHLFNQATSVLMTFQLVQVGLVVYVSASLDSVFPISDSFVWVYFINVK